MWHVVESAMEENQADYGGLGVLFYTVQEGSSDKGTFKQKFQNMMEWAKQKSGRRGFHEEAMSEKVQKRDQV